MSEFTNTKEHRLTKLLEVSKLLIKTGNALSFIKQNKDFIPTVLPSDFITLFDLLVKEGHKTAELKTLSNKILNIFHLTIVNHQRTEPAADTFFGILEQNNAEMEKVLNNIRPVFKQLVKDPGDVATRKILTALFSRLEIFEKQYVIKENVLFPVIEQRWPDYRCIQIMWSFHDDIRQNIKTILNLLEKGIDDMKNFNRLVGDVFFNMLAIKFRDEKILFPLLMETLSRETIDKMNQESAELGFPYFQPSPKAQSEKIVSQINDQVNLGTGSLTIEQIRLIFNHLPVDITFVDENDKVSYFSTPKKQIFPRTVAVIGREVKNCHPPESVHVVEKIVKSFRNGEKDKAVFWIKLKDEYILIQYFAVRDEGGNYRGVIEVSQEISDIKAIEGEKRLLDW